MRKLRKKKEKTKVMRSKESISNKMEIRTKESKRLKRRDMSDKLEKKQLKNFLIPTQQIVQMNFQSKIIWRMDWKDSRSKSKETIIIQENIWLIKISSILIKQDWILRLKIMTKRNKNRIRLILRMPRLRSCQEFPQILQLGHQVAEWMMSLKI